MSKLPNADLALVPRPKITDYLLSGDHPDGARKAAFLKRFGFEREAPETLDTKSAGIMVHYAEEDKA